MPDSDRILVLGLGNILYADEGLGVRVAERLVAEHRFPDHVSVVDGGTQGLHLLGLVEEASRLLILDAVDFKLAPGSLVRRQDGHIPAYLSAQKASVHQNSFSEVLALATLRGCVPNEIVLLGMQPVELGLGCPLSLAAREALTPLCTDALDVLAGWGVTPLQPDEKPRLLHDASLSLDRYEDQLPVNVR